MAESQGATGTVLLVPYAKKTVDFALKSTVFLV